MRSMDELTFWRTCCERGITVCRAPKPMREEQQCWLVEKHPTFRDRKSWVSAYTFDSMEQVFHEVGRYLMTGTEPRPQDGGVVDDVERLRRVLANYERGAVTDAELGVSIFPLLTVENLPKLLSLVSVDVLERLKDEAESAPLTDDGWRSLLFVMGGTFDASNDEAWKADHQVRYRQGVEALRQHFENG